MIDLSLHPDTQAILLLCGYFGGKDRDVQPLTLSEYNRLAAWLRREKLRPEDLLNGDGEARLDAFGQGKITPKRVRALLGRGLELGFAVEAWSRQGLWVVSRGEETYPRRLKARLREAAPALLFGAGERGIPESSPALGIVGSRDADEQALAFTRRVARQCAAESIAVVSGGAKGIDEASLLAALEESGTALAVLAEGIARPAVSKGYRRHIAEGRLVLVSPFHPGARWTTGNAMGRNKLIYALSDWTLVVSSSTRGGTWNGAVENLKKQWVPLLVCLDEHVPEGNRKLAAMGGLSLRAEALRRSSSLLDHLQALTTAVASGNGTPDLFSGLDTTPPTPRPGAGQAAQPPDAHVAGTEASGIVEAPSAVQVGEETQRPADGPPSVEEAAVAYDGATATPESLIGDLFQVVWPSLAMAFQEELRDRDLSETAERFNVQVAQLRAWIQQALELDLSEKRTRPVRYVRREAR